MRNWKGGFTACDLSNVHNVRLCVCSVQETYEQKRQDHLREMQGKEEQMRQMFVQKVCTPQEQSPHIAFLYFDANACNWLGWVHTHLSPAPLEYWHLQYPWKTSVFLNKPPNKVTYTILCHF